MRPVHSVLDTHLSYNGLLELFSLILLVAEKSVQMTCKVSAFFLHAPRSDYVSSIPVTRSYIYLKASEPAKSKSWLCGRRAFERGAYCY
jgi:hypothetical protein